MLQKHLIIKACCKRGRRIDCENQKDYANDLFTDCHHRDDRNPFLVPGGDDYPTSMESPRIIPLALGVVINLVADGAFHKASTTVKPFEESSFLVTDGVFRISRNPMYLGFVLVLIGIAVLLRALSPYVFILTFMILIQSMYITVEERMLAERFGARWQEYQRNTRRWL